MHKKLHAAPQYLEKLKWEGRYDIIHKALKTIDYDTRKLDDPEQQDAFVNAIHDEMASKLEGMLGVNKKKLDENLVRDIAESLLGITYRSIADTVRKKGGDLTPKEIMKIIEEDAKEFEAKHYVNIMKDYIKTPDHVKPALEYMGVHKDLVNIDVMQPEELYQPLLQHALGDENVVEYFDPKFKKPKKERARQKNIDKVLDDIKKQEEAEKRKKAA